MISISDSIIIRYYIIPLFFVVDITATNRRHFYLMPHALLSTHPPLAPKLVNPCLMSDWAFGELSYYYTRQWGVCTRCEA